MYAIYTKKKENSQYHYECIRKTSLFGCNSGKIVDFLRNKAKKDWNQPKEWDLDIQEEFTKEGKPDHTLIINLKPNNKDEISLYEIVKVWGYTSNLWTPIMLYLKGLYVDVERNKINGSLENFHCKVDPKDDPIFSMLYLDGFIKNGELKGKWTAPRPSPTNSALLWPDTFKYFMEEANKIYKKLNIL